MAKTRSPNYPASSLSEAIEGIKKVHKADLRNKMTRETVARHLGFKGLSGPSTIAIAALRAYGLLEGRGDELRVSSDAVAIIADPVSSAERQKAIRKAALQPRLFAEINSHYEGQRPSEENLRSYLIRKDFSSDAASRATRAYLDTFDLVTREGGEYDSGADQAQEPEMEPLTDTGGPRRPPMPKKPPVASSRQAVFPLSEGDVTLVFPADLSAAGYEELDDYLKIFLRTAKRDHSAKAQETFNKADEALSDDQQ